jgi:hypothetical protein
MHAYYPLSAYGDLSNMMHGHVQGRAREWFARTAADKAAISSVGELRQRGEYSVQNVMFQAAPEVYLTATVWRPVGAAARCNSRRALPNARVRACSSRSASRITHRPVAPRIG